MSNRVWPKAVFDLIEALEWRAERLNQPTNTAEIMECSNELPPLILMDAPTVDSWNSQEMFTGYQSATDFLARTEKRDEDVPNRVMALVTIGGSHRPHLVVFRLWPHAFDVLATVATLLAYYEGKERLPQGLAKETVSWLMERTNRVGYGSEDSERYSDKRGREAVRILHDAILQVSDVTEAPLLMQILEDERLAYSSHKSYTIGRATCLFCRTFGNPDTEHFNQVLTDAFELRARDIIARAFVGEVGYKFNLQTELNGRLISYRALPKSALRGALAHLPGQSELPEAGPLSLE